MTTIAIIMGDFLPTLSDNLLYLNKKQQKQTSFYTYLQCYCSRLHTYVLYFGHGSRDSPPKLEATKPTSKQASKASTTCLLGKNEAS